MENKKTFRASEHSLHICETKTVKKTYRLFVGPFSNQDPEFHNILNELYNADKDSVLELKIMSPGGEVIECQQITNLMQNKFKDNTVAYIESHASSAGAYVFASADKRIIYWNSRIMFHNYSGGYQGDYHKIKTRIDFDSKHIIGFIESAKRFFTEKEWNKLINGKEYWFTAKEMLERGLATHIILEGVEYDRKKGLKKLKKFLKEKAENHLES